MPRSVPPASVLFDSCGAYYFTLIVICGLPEKTTCPWALRTVRLGTVTVVEPLATAWKISVASTPEPDTPGVLGRRFRFMAAAPASFWMFLVNSGICPSLEKKSPRPASFSFTTLGSKVTCSGAEDTSVAFSMMRATVSIPCGVDSSCGGRKRTTALPVCLGAAGLAGSSAAGAVLSGAIGRAIPGAPIGGAVAGGAKPGASTGVESTAVGTAGLTAAGGFAAGVFAAGGFSFLGAIAGADPGWRP